MRHSPPRIGVPLGSLLAAALMSCAGAHPGRSPTLTIVFGRPADGPGEACALAEWTAPWGATRRACLDASSTVRVTRSDVAGFRIEDRQFGDRTWYVVSAHFAGGLSDRLWERVRPPPLSPSEIPPDASITEIREHLPDPSPYAVLVDDEVAAVLPGIAIGEFDFMVLVTEELQRAEAFAYAWGVPVDRAIAAEIAAEPVRPVSMVQLLASPKHWFGKRVSVQGFYSSLSSLFLSREHAEVFDYDSAVVVRGPATAQQAAALSGCEGRWVLIQGFVQEYRSLPEITRLERLEAFPGGPRCWPPQDEAPRAEPDPRAR